MYPQRPTFIPASMETARVRSPEELRALRGRLPPPPQMAPAPMGRPAMTQQETPYFHQNPIQITGGQGVGAEAQASAEEARTKAVFMGDPGIGALSVPPTQAEKNVGYASTAAPFIGMAAAFPPLAPVAAAFGVATLAEQYLGNKAAERNPSRFPAEWDKFPEDAKLAYMAGNDPVMAAQLSEWNAASGEDAGTNDMQNYNAMKSDPKGPKTFTEYMTKFRHKAEGRTTDMQNAAAAGLLLPYFQNKAGVTETGTQEAKYLTARNEAVSNAVMDVEPKLAAAYSRTADLITAFENGEYNRTGPVTGRIAKYFDSDTAGLEARSIAQALENLQITNLAPVTENEIALIRKMFADPTNRTAANIGILKEMLRRIQASMEELEPQTTYFRENKGSMAGYAPAAPKMPWHEQKPVPDAVPAAPAPPGSADPSNDPLLRPMQ